MCRRPGLSRIEVAILLLIVAFSAGLLLSAIGRIRTNAAERTCRNNQKRIGMAIHNYIDSFSRLPPLTDLGEGARSGNGLPSLFATILPYMESTPYGYDPAHMPPERYHAHSSVLFPYQWKDGTSGALDGGTANHPFKPFVDPSDTTANQLRDLPMPLPDGSTGYYATGSYAANGLLAWGREGLYSLGSREVILLAERPQVCLTATGDVVYNLWGVGFYSPQMPAFATLTPTEPAGLMTTGQIAPATPLPDDREALIRVKIGRVEAEAELPDFANSIQMLRKNQPCDPRLPGTPHAIGMPVVMADASVRVFTPNTSPWVFWSACTPIQP
jgi:hypothetical protein